MPFQTLFLHNNQLVRLEKVVNELVKIQSLESLSK